MSNYITVLLSFVMEIFQPSAVNKVKIINRESAVFWQTHKH